MADIPVSNTSGRGARGRGRGAVRSTQPRKAARTTKKKDTAKRASAEAEQPVRYVAEGSPSTSQKPSPSRPAMISRWYDHEAGSWSENWTPFPPNTPDVVLMQIDPRDTAGSRRVFKYDIWKMNLDTYMAIWKRNADKPDQAKAFLAAVKATVDKQMSAISRTAGARSVPEPKTAGRANAKPARVETPTIPEEVEPPAPQARPSPSRSTIVSILGSTRGTMDPFASAGDTKAFTVHLDSMGNTNHRVVWSGYRQVGRTAKPIFTYNIQSKYIKMFVGYDMFDEANYTSEIPVEVPVKKIISAQKDGGHGGGVQGAMWSKDREGAQEVKDEVAAQQLASMTTWVVSTDKYLSVRFPQEPTGENYVNFVGTMEGGVTYISPFPGTGVFGWEDSHVIRQLILMIQAFLDVEDSGQTLAFFEIRQKDSVTKRMMNCLSIAIGFVMSNTYYDDTESDTKGLAWYYDVAGQSIAKVLLAIEWDAEHNATDASHVSWSEKNTSRQLSEDDVVRESNNRFSGFDTDTLVEEYQHTNPANPDRALMAEELIDRGFQMSTPDDDLPDLPPPPPLSSNWADQVDAEHADSLRDDDSLAATVVPDSVMSQDEGSDALDSDDPGDEIVLNEQSIEAPSVPSTSSARLAPSFRSGGGAATKQDSSATMKHSRSQDAYEAFRELRSPSVYEEGALDNVRYVFGMIAIGRLDLVLPFLTDEEVDALMPFCSVLSRRMRQPRTDS